MSSTTTASCSPHVVKFGGSSRAAARGSSAAWLAGAAAVVRPDRHVQESKRGSIAVISADIALYAEVAIDFRERKAPP